jgi:hypothetical protein
MADFTLGEAIGLRGRTRMSEDIAEYGGRALAQAAKQAAERRKADEDLYADMEKNIRPPKDLQKLYIQPATDFTTDFLAQLRKLKSEGSLSQKGYELVDQYRELMSEIQVGSEEMKQFEDSYKKSDTYKSKAQEDFFGQIKNTKNIFDFADRIREKNIPGYDYNNYSFSTVPGQPSIGNFQKARNIEDDIRDRMRELTEVTIPPTGLAVDGQEMLEYGTQTFFTKKQAQEWANANPGKEVPSTVEDQVDALMQDEEFIFQFADSRGYSFDDSERIKKDLMEMAKGYADEEIKYKNQTRDMNIYLNTEEKPVFSDIKMSGSINALSSKKEIFSMANSNMTGYNIETRDLNLPASKHGVDENGVPVTTSISNAILTSTIVVPTVKGKNEIQRPIIKDIGTMKELNPSDIKDFKLYNVFVSKGGTRKVYIPYSLSDTQLELSKLPSDQMARFNNQIKKQQNLEARLKEIHNANKSNKDFELYKKINAYLSSRTLDAQDELNNYLQSLVN